VTPKKNVQFITYVSLVSQADTDIMQDTPTLAAGDAQVSIDGGALANLDTLPAVTPASSKMVKIILSADEMNGDNVTVVFCDAAGDEWQDLVLNIQTTAQQIDDLSTLTAAQAWANAERTLTMTAAEASAAMSGSDLTITRGDTLSLALTGLGSVADYVSLDFTVKTTRDGADGSAIIRIRKNESGADDGLLRLNGAAATAGNGSITIDDADAGDITITLEAEETDDLVVAKNLYYDVQKITATAVNTLTEGDCEIAADVTRAVV